MSGVGLGLPDASDPETLIDFADIEAGRVAEHFLYLGALILFAVHLLALPIGMVLLGVAMQRTPSFGRRLSVLAIALGVLGILGATIEIIDTGSDASAVAVLAVVLFHLASGWRTLAAGNERDIDLTGDEPAGAQA